MKGFGDAPKPLDEEYSPLDQALLLQRLILQLELEDLTLVGHSLGGGVAALATLALLEVGSSRVTGLVLVAGAALPIPVPTFLRLAARPILGRVLLRLLPSRWLIKKALEIAYFDPRRVTKSQIEAYAEPLRSPEGRYALSMTARQLLSPGVEERAEELRHLTIPTFLLWGEQDRVLPLWVGIRLAEVLSNARLATLPECGHMPQEERPEESLELVRAFLEGSPGGSSSA